MSARSPFAAINKAVTPSAERYVTLAEQAHIQLTSDCNRYKELHTRAVARDQAHRQQYQQQVRALKAKASERIAVLRAEMDTLTAKVRDLKQRLFGAKSERRKGSEESIKNGCPQGVQDQAGTALAQPRKARGQQRGAKGHGRTLHPHLPARYETVTLDDPACAQCDLPFVRSFGSEDAEVVEIEVKAYRRVIHRTRYQATCQCKGHTGIITAPARHNSSHAASSAYRSGSPHYSTNSPMVVQAIGCYKT